jgi:hypothetical protein
MNPIVRAILVSAILLVPGQVSGEHPVKFFPGWSYHHQDDQIRDGATLWAVIKNGDSYILTRRNVKIRSFHSPIRDNAGEQSGRELVAADRESSIIHFTGAGNLENGPVSFREFTKPLVNTFNPKIPPGSIDFDFEGSSYTVYVQVNKHKDMSIYLRKGTKTQLLCEYPKVGDALAWLQWVADIDRDNLPDLMVSASGHYSYLDHRFYLSSFAEAGKLVKEVGRFTDGQ